MKNQFISLFTGDISLHSNRPDRFKNKPSFYRSVVEVLLSAGMDVNIKTSGGTALHEAALCGKLDVVRTLLDAGVDLCVRDAKQNTVIDLLSQFPKHVTQDIFKTLKSKGSFLVWIHLFQTRKYF